MTIEDTLGKMLQLLESIDSKMEPRGRREVTRVPDKDDTACTTHPAAQATEHVPNESGPGVRDCTTVVVMLSRIVDALKGIGMIPEKESDGKKMESDGKEMESPLPKRFGLNFNQARRGNGASSWLLFSIFLRSASRELQL